jgi:L-threonylcarbamoyladenylate synthase
MITKITRDVMEAANVLRANQVIAIPTETVYGLAANGLCIPAVSEIFRVKQRPTSNPLILHFAHLDDATPYIQEFNQELKRLYDLFSPGPITYLVPKTEKVPVQITSGSALVAVRFPSHPIFSALLQAIDFPVAAPSANKYGSVSPTRAEEVFTQLNHEIPLILDGGACQYGLESTIVGMDEDRAVVYRLGSIDLDELSTALGYIPAVKNQAEHAPLAPGMVKYHYATHTPLHYITQDLKPEENIGYIFMHSIPEDFPKAQCLVLSTTGDLKEVARNLYHALITMDERGFHSIYIEKPRSEGLGLTILDRLQRATAKFNNP